MTARSAKGQCEANKHRVGTGAGRVRAAQARSSDRGSGAITNEGAANENQGERLGSVRPGRVTMETRANTTIKRSIKKQSKNKN